MTTPLPPAVATAAAATELEQLRARCATLEEANAALGAVNDALMDRVERDMDMQGKSFSLFQAAISLESTVQQRTAALTEAMHELERSNRELQASNEAAQAASRAKSAFLATMSHELRTPMNGVVGMTELLLNGRLPPAQQRRSVEVIRRSALSLLQILNDILDFSKIEAGQLETESVPFDLRKSAEQALSLLQPQAESKGLALRTEWPDELPTAVIGDPTRFAQILTNLVGNALKFTARGHVTLRASLLEARDPALRLRFEVEDTGVGIPADALPRLFQSFTQSDSSITRKYGGTGLGLAIVRRLCELMHGECGVHSEPGRGSTFWFTLALQQDPHGGRGPAPAATGLFPVLRPRGDAARGGDALPNVLLVEDNPVNQEVTLGMLELIGARATVAGDGRRAVELLARPHDFDLVLMDCQMPEMDGLEATRRTRAHERPLGLRVPIVALTANAMLGDRERCLEAGMDDFLSKPFRLRELASALERWCPRHAPVATPPSKETTA
ncbi:MAG: ATP-binding protein [Steroidobacteraceae bacterium]|jgi:signal transduction histidine kinase/ActR/RegA family two-component response regulator|nr:ATP-binding protein [Steroidobacteraceae bacterium]